MAREREGETHVLTGEWKKASKSNPSGNCVECRWEKSSRSNGNGGNNCVEVSRNALHNSLVFVRDSKQNGYPEENRTVLKFTQQEWKEFLGEVHEWVKGLIAWNKVGEHYAIVDPSGGDDELLFTHDEWTAFVDGVQDGEFDLP